MIVVYNSLGTAWNHACVTNYAWFATIVSNSHEFFIALTPVTNVIDNLHLQFTTVEQ